MFGFRGWELQPSVPKRWENSGAVAGAPHPPPRAAERAGWHPWLCVPRQGHAPSEPQYLHLRRPGACSALVTSEPSRLPPSPAAPLSWLPAPAPPRQVSAGLGLRCSGVYLPVDSFVSKLEIAL